MAMEHRTEPGPKPRRQGPPSGHPVLRIVVVWLFTGAVFVPEYVAWKPKLVVPPAAIEPS